MLKEHLYWLGFSLFSGIGPKKFHTLLKTFKSAKDAWFASEDALLIALGPALTKKFLIFRDQVDISSYGERLKKKDVWYVTLLDDEYPELLTTSINPPFVLYGKGEKSVLRRKLTLGVVGTRKITMYGRHVTELITRDLVAAGYVIVSGLAMGVDAVAHATTLAERGATIAVLGCGVDCCNPRVNQRLYEQIISSGGCVVSEFPLSQDPTIGSFPSRNRIIAGLSQAVVVTEGAEDSGALITAKDSFDNNRPVFAVPGPITSSLSRGPNALLKKGGRLVTGGEDVLKELGVRNSELKMKESQIVGDTQDEQRIIDLLKNEELSFDELRNKGSFDTAKLNMVLSLMEMKGYISFAEGSKYCLKQ